MQSIAITAQEIIDLYDIFLLDAYGVLVDSQSILPGARSFFKQPN